MNAHFKKKGVGGFTPQELIELSFDKKNNIAEVKPDLELFEKLVAKHGKRRKKKDGK